MPGAAETRRASAALGMPQLMSALSLLQSDPPVAFEQALGDTRASLADLLRKEVLAGARHRTRYCIAPGFSILSILPILSILSSAKELKAPSTKQIADATRVMRFR